MSAQRSPKAGIKSGYAPLSREALKRVQTV